MASTIIDIDTVDGDNDLAQQYSILCYLISSKTLYDRCSRILTPNLLDSELADALESIKRNVSRNGKLPDPTLVMAESSVKLVKPSDCMNAATIDRVAELVVAFVKRKRTEQLIAKAQDELLYDKEGAVPAKLARELKEINRISITTDLGFEMLSDYEELLTQSEKSIGIPIGLDLVDEALGGGVTEPSYNIISASSGEGKSVGLQNLAINYAIAGENVVYITLELSEFLIEIRLLAMLFGINIREVRRSKEEIGLLIPLKTKGMGFIFIKRFPIRGTTVSDLRSYVNVLMETFDDEQMVKEYGKQEWKRIIIDYPDLMRTTDPSIKVDNIHLRDKFISEEIYEWAHEKDHPKIIWGASQQVKGAKEEKSARQSGLAGGTGKVDTADNVLIFKRDRDDMFNERTWCYIEKGRGGGTGKVIPIHWDSKTLRMTSGFELRELMEEREQEARDAANGKKPTQASLNQKFVRDNFDANRFMSENKKAKVADVSKKINELMRK